MTRIDIKIIGRLNLRSVHLFLKHTHINPTIPPPPMASASKRKAIDEPDCDIVSGDNDSIFVGSHKRGNTFTGGHVLTPSPVYDYASMYPSIAAAYGSHVSNQSYASVRATVAASSVTWRQYGD